MSKKENKKKLCKSVEGLKQNQKKIYISIYIRGQKWQIGPRKKWEITTTTAIILVMAVINKDKDIKSYVPINFFSYFLLPDNKNEHSKPLLGIYRFNANSSNQSASQSLS